MSAQDHKPFRGDRANASQRPQRDAGKPASFDRAPRARDEHPRGSKPYGERRDGGFGSSDRPRFNRDDRGPRTERSFGGERGARREGGFGQSDRPSFNRDDRGPRTERSFGGERGPRREGGFGQSDRPSFNRDDRGPRTERSFGGERGPRREGGFGQSDRPSFNRDERGPRTERSFGGERGPRREGGFGQSDRPSFNRDERGPRTERSFGGERGPRRERGADQSERPRFQRDDRAPRRDEGVSGGDRPRFNRDADRAARSQQEGEERRSFGGIRTYRAPEALKGKAAPIKVIRPETVARTPSRPGEMRINKRMADLGMCSRREADEWVEKGWVLVNGKLATMGQGVTLDDRVELNPEARELQARQVTILLHKPAGYTSGMLVDGLPSALALVQPDHRWHLDACATRFNFSQLKGLAPAGLLDAEAEGLLVLTQDGRIARMLVGETSSLEKEYLIRVRLGERVVDVQSQVPAEALAALRAASEVDGEVTPGLNITWANPEQLRVVVAPGQKVALSRVCETLGLTVSQLQRVRIGNITLGDLPAGQWRYLASEERF